MEPLVEVRGLRVDYMTAGGLFTAVRESTKGAKAPSSI